MLSKRKIVGIAASLMAVLTITGCGGGKDKTFTYGTMAYGPAMANAGTNPHESYCGWSTIRYGIGETLFKFNDNMELEPWIAKDFEQIDDYTLKINLKDNVVFSNGKKVTGDAVKKCLEHLIKTHDRAPADLKIASITADGQSVTITSTEKVPVMINYLSDPYGCIVDVESGEKDRIVVGTGPYKAIKVTDTQVDLVKNENYWGDVLPKMDKITVRSITDGGAMTMAMQNGELDAVQGLPYASLELFQEDKYQLSKTETSRTYQVAFNYKTEALSDIRVRKAISMAIDKEAFAQTLLKGNGVGAVGPFPANLTFGDRAVIAPGYDVDAAKTLLAEAGYVDSDGDGYVDKDGETLELRYLTYTSRQELPLLAEYFQESLKKIGVNLKVNATDNYQMFLKGGQYDIYAKAIVTAPTGDAEYYLTSHIIPGAPYNSGFYDSPVVGSLAGQLRNTFGAAQRADLAKKISQQILDDCAVFYAAHLRMTLVMKKGVSGFAAHPSDYYEITPELDKL